MKYASLRSRAQRISTILEHANKHVCDRLMRAYPNGDAPYEEDRAVMLMQDVLNAASARVWAEVDAARKVEGIGTYTPYGRPYRRRR